MIYQLVSLAEHVSRAPVDLAVLDVASPASAQATVTVQTPPTQDELVQHVVEILLAGYALHETAQAIAALVPGISARIVMLAIGNSGGMHGHTAHAKLETMGLHVGTPGAKVASSAAQREVFYRAAYILRASERIGADITQGEPIGKTLADEKVNFKAHESARRGRLDAAARAGQAANAYGPLLGWYLDPLLNNEAECIAANGHNFYADQSTVIGDPGSVHPRCGCVPGPPIEGAGMVNDAIAKARAVVIGKPRKYGLFGKAS